MYRINYWLEFRLSIPGLRAEIKRRITCKQNHVIRCILQEHQQISIAQYGKILTALLRQSRLIQSYLMPRESPLNPYRNWKIILVARHVPSTAIINNIVLVSIGNSEIQSSEGTYRGSV